MTGPKSPKLLFVTGRERSGTTLLQYMLNLQSEMVVAPEATFMWDLLSILQKHPEKYFKNPHLLIRLLRKDVRFNLWKLNNVYLHEQIVEAAKCDNRNYQSLMRAIILAFGVADGKTAPSVVGIKHPAYAMFLPELLKAFPHAHVLHIVRDYRDVLHSMLQLPFELKNAFTMSHRWVMYNNTFLRMADRAPERCSVIRYEDLVQNPERTLAPFLAKYGLKWENKMLNVAEYLHYKQVDTGMLAKYQKHLNQPVSHQFIGKGKYLSERQLHIANEICGELGMEFGYEIARQKFPMNKAVLLVTKFWASLYFRLEKLSSRLKPALKIQYLQLKKLLAAGWHQDVTYELNRNK